MKAYLINPEAKSIESIDINSLEDVKKTIGFDTIISDEVGSDDHIYFDEECFLRGTSGRFQIDKLIPVSGKGVVVGSKDQGNTLCDVRISLDELKTRLTYL